MSRFSLFSQFSGLHGLLIRTPCRMVRRFTISHVSLIMIKLFIGWELVNSAARSSL